MRVVIIALQLMLLTSAIHAGTEKLSCTGEEMEFRLLLDNDAKTVTHTVVGYQGREVITEVFKDTALSSNTLCWEYEIDYALHLKSTGVDLKRGMMVKASSQHTVNLDDLTYDVEITFLRHKAREQVRSQSYQCERINNKKDTEESPEVEQYREWLHSMDYESVKYEYDYQLTNPVTILGFDKKNLILDELKKREESADR